MDTAHVLSVLMDIKNLEVRSLFTKLILGITLVVCKKKRVRCRKCKRYTLGSFSLASILEAKHDTEMLLVRRREHVCSMTRL